MVVSIELSGVLEKKLRKLVELGVYASVSEAVRDAVRRLLSDLDLRSLALELYTSREASILYVAELAGETMESMIDYMIYKGVAPALGAFGPDDYREPGGGEVVLDPSSVYVVYKSRMLDVLRGLEGRITIYVPRAYERMIDLLAANRIRLGLQAHAGLETVNVRLEEAPPGVLVTDAEYSAIKWASSRGVALISDDYRVRLLARREGVDAYSSLSLATLAAREGVLDGGLVDELVLSLRSIPVAVPPEAVEAWR